MIIEYIFKQIVQFKKLNHEELEKGKKSKPSTPVSGVADGNSSLTGGFGVEAANLSANMAEGHMQSPME